MGDQLSIRGLMTSDGSGLKILDPVSHLWFGFELGKFPLKMSIFSLRGQKKSLWVGSKSILVKGGSSSYLLRVKSKLGLGQGPISKLIRSLSIVKKFMEWGILAEVRGI